MKVADFAVPAFGALPRRSCSCSVYKYALRLCGDRLRVHIADDDESRTRREMRVGTEQAYVRRPKTGDGVRTPQRRPTDRSVAIEGLVGQFPHHALGLSGEELENVA